jgi:hypothetical protein
MQYPGKEGTWRAREVEELGKWGTQWVAMFIQCVHRQIQSCTTGALEPLDCCQSSLFIVTGEVLNSHLILPLLFQSLSTTIYQPPP